MSDKVIKEPFNFSYTIPVLDWYDEIEVTVNENDYDWFRLERRYGDKNSWYLIGCKQQDQFPYHKDKDLGQIWLRDIKRFIEWAKTKSGGSRILEIRAISSTFDLLETINKELL